MSNVLSDEKKNQVLALGGLGLSLRRIEEETGVRRETPRRTCGRPGSRREGRGRPEKDWKPKPAITEEVSTDPDSRPTITWEVSTGSGGARPGRAPSAGACEPFRELIEEALSRGRNAMAIYQDLVDDHGFGARYKSVKRFVKGLRARLRSRHAWSSQRRRARRRRSITAAMDRWCGKRQPASTDALGCSS